MRTELTERHVKTDQSEDFRRLQGEKLSRLTVLEVWTDDPLTTRPSKRMLLLVLIPSVALLDPFRPSCDPTATSNQHASQFLTLFEWMLSRLEKGRGMNVQNHLSCSLPHQLHSAPHIPSLLLLVRSFSRSALPSAPCHSKPSIRRLRLV